MKEEKSNVDTSRPDYPNSNSNNDDNNANCDADGVQLGPTSY